MLRLARGTIAVRRRLWLEARMENLSTNDPASGDRRATVLVDMIPPCSMILHYFVDHNIQTLLASGRKEMLRQLVRSEPCPEMRSASGS
jgi:hypothetical protein